MNWIESASLSCPTDWHRDPPGSEVHQQAVTATKPAMSPPDGREGLWRVTATDDPGSECIMRKERVEKDETSTYLCGGNRAGYCSNSNGLRPGLASPSADSTSGSGSNPTCYHFGSAYSCPNRSRGSTNQGT